MALYVSTSNQRNSGCMKVRCPSNTRAIYRPRGFAHTRISPRKIAICKTPMLVIVLSSEFLRTKKREDQVDKQTQCRDSSNHVVHGLDLLQLVAGLGKGPAEKQKYTSDSDVKQIEHGRLLRFLVNHFVARIPQPAGQNFILRWPPSFWPAHNHNRAPVQERAQGLEAIAAEINLHARLYQALGCHHAEAPLAELNQHRWAFKGKRVRHYLRHHQLDSCAEALSQCGGFAKRCQRGFHRRKHHGDV